MTDAPAHVIALDVESRSRADLKVVGGRRYWDHPSSEILCMVLHDTSTDEREVWSPYYDDAPPELLSRDLPLAAHNAIGFDAFALDRYGFGRPLVDWVDTSELARRAGLPGALDALGTRWLGIPKDKTASKYTTGLSAVRRPTKKTAHLAPGNAAITPAEWRVLGANARREAGYLCAITNDVLARVITYCESDVDIMVHGWPLLHEWLSVECLPDPAEVTTIDREINERGFAFDRALARRLKAECARNVRLEIERLAALHGWAPDELRDAASSPKQFVELTGASDAQAPTIEALIEAHPETDPVGALARARQASASIASGKLSAGLARVSDDGRVRDSLRYFAAHTGRWGGKGFQPHNLPRPDDAFEHMTEDELDSLALDVTAGRHATPEEVDLLLRATIWAPPGRVLYAADYTGIENRALAWTAGDYPALDAIERGLDDYKISASAIYEVPYEAVTKQQRKAGKIGSLACGYQGGVNAILKFARSMRIDLDAVGVDPGSVVGGWRKLHPAVVRMWYLIDDAFKIVARGDVAEACVSVYTFVASDDGSSIAAYLPSGRPIVYNDVRLHREQVTDRYGRTRVRETSSYSGRKGREHTYGGKLTENLTQALCREILVHGLKNARDAGLKIILDVHDEIVGECPLHEGASALEQLSEAMLDVPAWAHGMPIACDGYVSRRYKK